MSVLYSNTGRLSTLDEKVLSPCVHFTLSAFAIRLVFRVGMYLHNSIIVQI